jgi:hypothetical protein
MSLTVDNICVYFSTSNQNSLKSERALLKLTWSIHSVGKLMKLMNTRTRDVCRFTVSTTLTSVRTSKAEAPCLWKSRSTKRVKFKSKYIIRDNKVKMCEWSNSDLLLVRKQSLPYSNLQDLRTAKGWESVYNGERKMSKITTITESHLSLNLFNYWKQINIKKFTRSL